MMASLQTCGTVPVLHPSLNSCNSFFLLHGPWCRSISFVMLSGPGAFLSFSIVKASSSSLLTNGEFIVGSSLWTGLACCSFLVSLFLSVGTCRSLVSAYCLIRMLAACLPALSFPSCSRTICGLFGFSSLRAATRFQNFLPSRSRLSCSVFSCQVLRASWMSILWCFADAAFREILFSSEGLCSTRFLASLTVSSCCWSSSVQ